jgi:G3E family GTPase
MSEHACTFESTGRKASVIKKIPVTLLTGFLGSGKTTVLSQVLTSPSWANTVVLVNELGAVGLDHHLMWGASDAVLVLENGCICCSVRDDLVGVLEELFWQRLQRQIARFDRVVIETTGLADPRPIIKALLSHGLVSERYALDCVLCTVDALLGEGQLEGHPESLAQTASADVLLVTKTDIAEESCIQKLETELRAVNPLALIQRTVPGQLLPGFLQGFPLNSTYRVDATFSGGMALVPQIKQGVEPAQFFGRGPAGRLHHDRVQTMALHFNRPWQWEEFELALRTTLTRHGDSILRIKGLIDVADDPCPVVVQAVQQTIFPVDRLSSWPDGKVRSFIVCIAIGLTEEAMAEAFRFHADLSVGDFRHMALGPTQDRSARGSREFFFKECVNWNRRPYLFTSIKLRTRRSTSNRLSWSARTVNCYRHLHQALTLMFILPMASSVNTLCAMARTTPKVISSP